MKLSMLIEAMGGTAVGLTHDPELYYYDSYNGIECKVDPAGVQFVINGMGPGSIEKLIMGGPL